MEETKNPIKNNEKFWGKSLLVYFREYCNKTSIHGFRYFGERRTMFEKLWWFFIFLFCLGACLLSIITVYQKWRSSPVIVSFATKSVKIYEIPFPAITVCSNSKVNSNKFNVNQKLLELKQKKKLSQEDKKILQYVSTLCSLYKLNLNMSENLDNDEFFSIMEYLTPNFYPVNCYALGIPKSCHDYFRPIITDEGLCYTANILDRQEIYSDEVTFYKNYHRVNQNSTWTIEKGYDSDSGIVTYPERALLAGARYAFRFELKTNKNEIDNTCGESIEGYTVILHSPLRIPRPTQEHYRIPLDKTVVAAVRPQMITTSNTVRDYSPKVRGCYFSSERGLKYFKMYNQENCRLECITNFTLSMCGCATFYMPRINDTRICNRKDLECQVQAEYLAQAKDLIEKMDTEVNSTLDNGEWCDCMPLCSDIEYHVVISQSEWNWTDEAILNYDTVDDSEIYLSKFSVYFPASDFIPSQRSELYGPTDFLANFGGLLGLFTGFSFLSLIEIIYFCSVRLIGNRQLYGYWAGAES